MMARARTAAALAFVMVGCSFAAIAGADLPTPVEDAPSPAPLATWQSGYDWAARHGYGGWNEESTAVDSGAYSFARGLPGGPGLWIWPTGDRRYEPGSGEWVYRAPAASRIAAVRARLSYDPRVLSHHCIHVELQTELPVEDDGGEDPDGPDEDEEGPTEGDEEDGDRQDAPPDARAVDDFSFCKPVHGREDITVDLTDPSGSAPTATRVAVRLEIDCDKQRRKACVKHIPAADPEKNGLQVQAVDLRLTDDDLPSVEEPSGEFRELAGQYIGGADAHPLSFLAEDASSGIARVGVQTEDGRVLKSQEADCDPTHHRADLGARICPGAAAEDLEISAAELPEGRLTVQAFASDLVGHRGESEPWTVSVDRTAPTAATGLAARYEADLDGAAFDWSSGVDPLLADGSPGSGADRDLFRWRRPGGQWSGWASPGARAPAVADGVRAGEVVELEVLSFDQVGNTSQAASASVAVLPDDGRDKSNDIAFSTFEDPEGIGSGGGAVSAAAVGAEPVAASQLGRRNRCAFSGRGPSLEGRDGEDDVQIAGFGILGCPVNDPGFQKMEVTACIQFRRRGDWRTFRCERDEQRTPQPPLKVSVERRCLAGRHNYRMHVKIKVRLAGRGDIDDDQSFNQRELGCNEAGAWRLRAAAVSSPSRVLGQALGRSGDPRPARGFEAHHVIASRETGGPEKVGEESQKYGYACGLSPHTATNGVWLRGPGLKAGTPGYARLPKRLRRRPEHRRIHTDRYFRYVADVLDDAIGNNLSCDRRQFGAFMQFLKVRLEYNLVPR